MGILNRRSKSRARSLILKLGVIYLAAGISIWYLNGGFTKERALASTMPSAPVSAQAFQLSAGVLPSTIPLRIQINRLGIDLAVAKGYYNPDTAAWTLGNNEAFFAVGSAEINTEKGNTLIYGHNNKTAFDKLLDVKNGDEVRITGADGHVYIYNFRYAQDVKPNQTSLFGYNGRPILTLQTCSGFWYQNRRLSVFDYVRMEN